MAIRGIALTVGIPSGTDLLSMTISERPARISLSGALQLPLITNLIIDNAELRRSHKIGTNRSS